MSAVKTLGQFIIERQDDFPYAKGELSRLLRDLAIAAKIVNREINKAGLVDILGEAGTTNVQGEGQKKLDVYANEQFIAALQSGGECCIVVSEENDEYIYIDSQISKDAKYIVAIDPLDGSSNIDVNVGVGTIFSIYRRISTTGKATLQGILFMVHQPCWCILQVKVLTALRLIHQLVSFVYRIPTWLFLKTERYILLMKAITPIFRMG